MIYRSLVCVFLFLHCSTESSDTVPPNVSCLSTVEETTTSSYATVTWVEPVVTDNVDAGLTATCSPFSGSLFAVGSTTVTCSSTDEAGNTGSCTFTVNVFDVGRPDLTCNADMRVGRRRTLQAVVSWNLPEVYDSVDKILSPSCIDISVSDEPLSSPLLLVSGVYTITCSATDDSANTGFCSFKIIVEYDDVPPNLSCSEDLLVTSPSLTAVTWNDPMVIENFDSVLPTVVCSPQSGSLFSPGSTLVLCQSTDKAGNTGTCSFRVNVTVGEALSDGGASEHDKNAEQDTTTPDESNDYSTKNTENTMSFDENLLIILPTCGIILVVLLVSVMCCRLFNSEKNPPPEMRSIAGNNNDGWDNFSVPVSTFSNSISTQYFDPHFASETHTYYSAVMGDLPATLSSTR